MTDNLIYKNNVYVINIVQIHEKNSRKRQVSNNMSNHMGELLYHRLLETEVRTKTSNR